MSTSIDPATAERLVRLKTFLHAAQAAATDHTDPGLHAAVVALDGVCELAAGLAATELGIEMQRDRRLPALVDRLRTELDPRWTHRLKGFRELHRARNSAQHEGVLPNASQLAIWAAEAEGFTRSLIAATFDEDLESVALADAVHDEELRKQLRSAEQALDDGDFGKAIAASYTALTSALLTFQRGRGRWNLSLTAVLPNQDQFAIGRLGNAMKAIEGFLDIATFASDPAEWVWLSSVAQIANLDTEPGLTRAEAQRALVFSVAWILRYEAFSSRYVNRRLEPADSDFDPFREYPIPKARPKAIFNSGSQDSIGLQFELNYSPPPVWDIALTDSLESITAGQTATPIRAWREGSELKLEIPEGLDALSIETIVNELLQRTQQLADAKLDQLRREILECQAAAEAFAAAASTVDPDGRIRRVAGRSGRSPHPICHISVDLDLPHDVDEGDLWHTLMSRVAALRGSNASIGVSRNNIVFPSGTIAPADLLPLLDEAIAEIRSNAAKAKADRRLREQRHQDLLSGLQRRLGPAES